MLLLKSLSHLYLMHQTRKTLRERQTSTKAAHYPHMALFLVPLASYPANFIKICWPNAFQQITAEKRFSRSIMFDYKSCSRVAWSHDPACTVPLTCQRTSRDKVTLLGFGSRSTPIWHCQKCNILHFPVLRLKGDPEQSRNLTRCFLYHCRSILKISSKSVKNFLSNVANRQRKAKTLRPSRL